MQLPTLYFIQLIGQWVESIYSDDLHLTEYHRSKLEKPRHWRTQSTVLNEKVKMVRWPKTEYRVIK